MRHNSRLTPVQFSEDTKKNVEGSVLPPSLPLFVVVVVFLPHIWQSYSRILLFRAAILAFLNYKFIFYL